MEKSNKLFGRGVPYSKGMDVSQVGRSAIGVSMSFRCSVNVLAKSPTHLDEIKKLVEDVLPHIFASDINDKLLQEMIIYALHVLNPNVEVVTTRTYEWGERTIKTQCFWDTIISTTVGSAYREDKLYYPLEKIVHTSQGSAKLVVQLEIGLKPVVEKSCPPPGLIYPALTVPQVVLRYRDAHSKRAASEALKPDKKL